MSLGARLDGDLGSKANADWFRTTLQGGKLYAFTFDTPNVADLRVSVRGAGGKVLKSANLDVADDPDFASQQLNFRPQAAGTYYISVEAGMPPAGASPAPSRPPTALACSRTSRPASPTPCGWRSGRSSAVGWRATTTPTSSSSV